MYGNQSKMQALVQQWRYFNDFASQIEGHFPTVPLAVLADIAVGRVYATNPYSGVFTLNRKLTIAASASVTAYLAFSIARLL